MSREVLYPCSECGGDIVKREGCEVCVDCGNKMC